MKIATTSHIITSKVLKTRLATYLPTELTELPRLLDERRGTAICQEARHYNLITGYAARRVFTIGGRLLPPCDNILGGIQYCSL